MGRRIGSTRDGATFEQDESFGEVLVSVTGALILKQKLSFRLLDYYHSNEMLIDALKHMALLWQESR